MYKITKRFKPIIQAGGKVKRTGRAFYEVAYFTDSWHFKEFDTSMDARHWVINHLAI